MKTFVRTMLAAVLVTSGLTIAPAARALPDGLAPTPPMGFNNWNTTGCDINEQMIRDMADLFVSKGLKDVGYEYVNVDDCWAAAERDPVTGRYLPHPVKFPSGIKALADYVHGKGLKFGIYTSAGVRTCAKTMPGSLGFEDIDAQTFADWGVDYLKYDNCNNQGVPAIERYTKMRDALKKTGRPIVYSLCEWGENKPWEWGAEVGHLWRTTGDINDTWAKTVDLFKRNAPLAQYAGPGHWNDPDMLEVGNGGMTTTEYRSHFGLWAMMAAPLLIGSDLREISPEHLDILRNKEVIDLDQDKLGKQADIVSGGEGRWVLRKPLANGDVAVALFNEGEAHQRISTSAAELGLPPRPGYALRDVWQHKDFQTAGRISALVPPHATVIYRIEVGAHDWARYEPLVSTGLEIAAHAPGVPGTITPAGQPFEVTVSATNHARVPVAGVRAELRAPDGWPVEQLAKPGKWLVGTEEAATARWRVVPPAGAEGSTAELTGTVGYRTFGHGTGGSTSPATVTVPPAPPTGAGALSDVGWVLARNGYGPPEKDMSNGSVPAGDGKPLTINGVTYAKGIGAHAVSEVVFFLDGRCSALTTDVGVDDEREPAQQRGSASFEIWADGRVAAASGVRTWQDPATTLSADLTGARFLRLVVTDGGDGNAYDRGDWAGPRLTCQ
ncbi:NPCBM/NEW2 domain-containing protein [Amycolatopsis sp. YIM 10]|uniref:NPCBM/NEW2 domain-containing protein n=1 Tax=Amycolatopsis sp. YIM 10 TaxID=2653857 RepID=UPI0012A8C469|nr:NPCBM/NEW2 domain-containing protein [Amycolatopsis sp. YIM 10]QFU93794.1 Alpha-galactosidase A precursor [Amycolatopsis sp. YIM 10]